MPDGPPLEQRLLALFLQELEDNVAVLNRGLLVLESDAGQAPSALIAELFRAAHSLKGAAHSANVRSAVVISDRLEERLAALRDGAVERTPAILRELFSNVDALTAEGRRLRGAGEPTADLSDKPELDAGGRDALAGAATVRVAAQKLDALLDRSAELRVSSQRLHALAAALAESRDRAESATGERAWPTTQRPGATPPTASDTARISGRRASDRAGSVLNAELGQLSKELSMAARTLSLQTNQVVEATQDLRLQPFKEVCEGLDRAVRDLAAATGKKAAFTLDGGDLEIDRGVASALREPLLHLLRNAVDHGVEPAGQRIRTGKAEVGAIRVAAAIREGNVEVSVADDGAGVDLAGLRLAAETQQRTLPDSDLELAFAAGLSTASAVSDVSGRGVGLDAVRSRIERLGGSVKIETNPGTGTQVVLTVPRTLSTLRALIVSVDGEAVALPHTAVRRLVRLEAADIREAEGRPYAMVDGEPVPLIPLSAALAFTAPSTTPDPPTINGVVVATGAGEAIAIVDGLLDEVEIVLKGLPPRAADLPGILGATLLADGRPVLVVSPSAAIRLGVARQSPVEMRARPPSARAKRVLLAEDTLTTRVLEQSILEGAGYEVAVASDGAQAWRMLHDQAVDIVVSDVDMPEMDGVALCRAIKTAALFSGIPVVLVTSLASDDDRQRGLDAGANAYIVKSAFDQGTLLDTLEQLL